MSTNNLICEKLAPGEVYLLYKDSKGVMWVGNKDGEVLVAKTYFKEK